MPIFKQERAPVACSSNFNNARYFNIQEMSEKSAGKLDAATLAEDAAVSAAPPKRALLNLAQRNRGHQDNGEFSESESQIMKSQHLQGSILGSIQSKESQVKIHSERVSSLPSIHSKDSASKIKKQASQFEKVESFDEEHFKQSIKHIRENIAFDEKSYAEL